MDNFGKQFKELRNSKNISLRQLERQSGVSNSFISQIERGKRNIPKPSTLEKLAKGLRISKEEIFKMAGLETDNSIDKYKPDWANEKDVLELDKFLQTNGEMTFKGVELDAEQKQRVTEVLTQVFWNELNKKKKREGDL